MKKTGRKIQDDAFKDMQKQNERSVDLSDRRYKIELIQKQNELLGKLLRESINTSKKQTKYTFWMVVFSIFLSLCSIVSTIVLALI